MTNETKVNKDDETSSRPQTAPGIEKDDVKKKKKGKVSWSPQTTRPVTAPAERPEQEIEFENVRLREREPCNVRLFWLQSMYQAIKERLWLSMFLHFHGSDHISFLVQRDCTELQ